MLDLKKFFFIVLLISANILYAGDECGGWFGGWFGGSDFSTTLNSSTTSYSNSDNAGSKDSGWNKNTDSYYVSIEDPGSVEITVTGNQIKFSYSEDSCPSKGDSPDSTTATYNFSTATDFNLKVYRSSGSSKDYTITINFTPSVPQEVDTLVDYRFDECEWDGTSGEVVDSANGDYNATIQNGANTESNLTVDGGICRVGDFIDGDKALLVDGDISLPNKYTITLWAKFPIDSSNHNDFSGKQYYNIADRPGPNSDYIYFKKYSNNWKLCVYGNNYECLDYSDVSTLTGWHYLVFKVSNNGTEYYLDGSSALSFSEHPNGGKLGLILNSDYGSNSDNQANGQSIGAYADEFKIFNSVLSDFKINKIYDNEKDKKNYDGSDRNCQYCANLNQCYTDDFDRTELGDQWSIIKEENYTPKIELNKLMLTKNDKNIATGVTLSGKFPANNNYIVIEFEHNAYGNNGGGADGVTVALADASVVDPLIEENVSDIAGAYGGSLGYAQRNGIHGFKGGWLGIGLDEYGNYSNPTEGRIGGPGMKKDAIAIRGHWDENDESNGYEYINGTETLDPGIDATVAKKYKYKISIDTRNSTQKIKVERDIKDGNGYQIIIGWFDASQNGATPPQNFKLSFTGSTGGVKNYHSIDDLNIGAVSCGTLGEDEDENINYKFDAWDTWRNLNDRNISTKVVSQSFELTIASFNEDGTDYEEFNGTVCSRVLDINDNNLTDWVKTYFNDKNTSDQTVDGNPDFNVTKANRNVKINIKWVKNINYPNCDFNEDNETNATDNFAIRPDKFTLNITTTPLIAGSDFNLTAKALDESGNEADDYNETKGSSFDVDANITSSGCTKGAFLLDDFNFTDGIKEDINGSYDDVGELNITIKEINGSEFAVVDADDTNDTQRLIEQNSTVVTFIPHHFAIVNYNFTRNNPDEEWRYMADVEDANISIAFRVEAKNEQNNTTKNFDAACAAEDVGVKIDFSVSNNDANVSYFESINNITTTGHDRNLSNIDFAGTIDDSNFTDGNSSEVIYALNVYRVFDEPKEPRTITVQEINTTSSTVKNIGLAPENNNSKFYYARLYTQDLSTSETTDTVKAKVLVYDTSNDAYVSGLQEELTHWYYYKPQNEPSNGDIIALNVSSSITKKSSNEDDISATSSFDNNGSFTISVENPGENRSTHYIHLDVSPWIWYVYQGFGSDYNDSVGSECTSHPCIKYNYHKESNGNGVNSGSTTGVHFGVNVSKNSRGIRLLR